MTRSCRFGFSRRESPRPVWPPGSNRPGILPTEGCSIFRYNKHSLNGLGPGSASLSAIWEWPLFTAELSAPLRCGLISALERLGMEHSGSGSCRHPTVLPAPRSPGSRLLGDQAFQALVWRRRTESDSPPYFSRRLFSGCVWTAPKARGKTTRRTGPELPLSSNAVFTPKPLVVDRSDGTL